MFCFVGCLSLLVWLIIGEWSIPGLTLGEREMLDDCLYWSVVIRLPIDA